jgi:cytochrome c biogenesis protein CcmG, thiol:disulfide interchange protein DsbE
VPRVDLRRLPLSWLAIAASLPLLLLALLGVALVTREPARGAEIGRPAPSFVLADLDGRPLRLADLAGRPVIVNFWASWCGPCFEEFPMLRDALAEHADDGLAIVGIVYQDRSESARGFMEGLEATWPAAMDPGGRVAAAYGVNAPPETFFIDRAGVVRGRQLGPLTEATLADKLAAIIDED